MPIYGSERVGLYKPDLPVRTNKLSGADPASCIGCNKHFHTIDMAKQAGYFARNLVKKEYELKDHLGNVRVTVNDRKNSNGTANLLSYSNYYAFGMLMPGKSYNNTSYRYGFNGQEKIDEVYGSSGTYLDFTFRGYNPRIGRFFAVDPLTSKYPELTPYQFASNTPIWARELEGLEAWYTNDDKKTSDEFGSGPQNDLSGPLTDEYASKQGYTQYGVNNTVPNFSFSSQEVQNFENWNAAKGPTESGQCLGCATTGSEMLTGADAGFRNSSGKNVLSGKTLYDLGSNLEKAGYAVELPTRMNQETTTILNNPNAAQTENTAYLLGPAGAYHSMILIRNTAGNTFSLFDQGTGWDIKNTTPQGAQIQISDINSIHPDWGSRMWQLFRPTTVEVKYPIRK